MVRAEIILSGSVQGVGCRFATQRAARRLNLVGTVENLADGRVRIVAEGREDVIRQLPAEIAAHPSVRIRDTQWCFATATGQFLAFEIIR